MFRCQSSVRQSGCGSFGRYGVRAANGPVRMRGNGFRDYRAVSRGGRGVRGGAPEDERRGRLRSGARPVCRNRKGCREVRARHSKIRRPRGNGAVLYLSDMAFVKNVDLSSALSKPAAVSAVLSSTLKKILAEDGGGDLSGEIVSISEKDGMVVIKAS